jgi:hypothetical protein
MHPQCTDPQELDFLGLTLSGSLHNASDAFFYLIRLNIKNDWKIHKNSSECKKRLSNTSNRNP